MLGETSNKAQLQRLKWITLGLAVVAVTLIELFYVLVRQAPVVESLLSGLMAMVLAFGLMYFAFRIVFRIYDETEHRAEEMAALRETMLDITGRLDMSQLLASIIERASKLVGATGGLIHLYDAERGELRCYVSHNLEKDYTGLTLAVGEGVAGKVMQQGTPLIIADHRTWEGKSPQVADSIARAIVAVPLKWREEIIGVLDIMDTTGEKAFDERDVHLLSLFADQAAIAIENARLYKAEQRRRQEAETLRGIAQALNQALSPEEMLEIVLREAMTLVGRREGSIILLDGETNTMRIVASYGLPPEAVDSFNSRPVYSYEGTFGIVLRTGEMLEIPNTRSDPRVLHDIAHVPEQLTNVPMRTEEGVIGIIALDALPPDEQARRLLRALADLAAVAIQRARLFDAERRQRQEAETLRQAALALTTSLSRNQVVERILDQLQQVVPYDSASVQLLKGDHLEIIGGHGFPNLEELLGVSFPVNGDNPNREVMRRRAPFIVEDAPAVYQGFRQDPHTPANIRGWLGVPLLIGNRLIGMIALDRHQPGFYTQEHAQLALAFATQAAVAIENARLFEELQQRVAELEALQRTSLQLTSSLDLSAVLDSIAESALTLVGATDCHIFLYDEAGETFTFGTALWADGRREPAVKLPRRHGLTATVAREGRPMVINDATHHPLYATPEARKWGLQAIAGFPLKRAGRVLGVFTIVFLEPHTFSEEELRVLGLLADQAAIAIENARLYEEAKGYANKLAALYDTGKDITSILESDAVLRLITKRAAQLTGADKSLILLVDTEAERLIKAVGSGFAPGHIEGITYQEVQDGISGWVLRERQPTISEDILTDPRNTGLALQAVKKEHERGKSVAVAPLLIKGKVIGTLTVINNVGKPVFSQSDLELVLMLASQAAIAIENARLYEAEQRQAACLAQIVQLGAELANLREENALLQTLAERTAAIASSPACTVMLVDETANEAVLVAQAGLPKDTPLGLRAPLDLPIILRSLETGEPIIVPDIDRDAPELRTVLIRKDIQAFFAYPMVREERVLGYITLSSLAPHTPSAEEITAYRLLAERAAAALKNARLFQETVAHAQEMTALFEAAQAISGSLDLDETLKTVARLLLQAVDVHSCTISDWDQERNRVVTRFTLFHGPEPETWPGQPGQIFSLDDYPATVRVLHTREPLVIRLSDPAADPAEVALMREFGVKTYLMLPLVARDKVIGLVGLQDHEREREFSFDELRLAQTLVTQAAVAIDNARLFGETQRRLSELSALFEVSSALRGAATVEQMLPIIVEKTMEVMGAEIGGLVLLDRDTGDLVIRTARGEQVKGVEGQRIALAGTIIEQTLQTGQPYISSDLSADSWVPEPMRRQLRGGGSGALFPLRVGDEPVGALGVGFLNPHVFRDVEVRVLTAISNMAASAIRRASLFEELQRVNARLRRALKAKEEMIQNVSHELRTPLALIQGYAELMEQGGLGTLRPEQADAVRVMVKKSQQLGRMIELLIAMQSPDRKSVHQERVDLVTLVEEVTTAWWVRIKTEGFSLELHSDVERLPVLADADDLRRVLDNLLHNAFKFSPPGGRVTVRVWNEEKEARLAVSDQGIGLAPDQLEPIFERFYQVHSGMTRRYGGMGLGLALCKEIVQAHGGRIWAESEGKGKGSTFHIALPLGSPKSS